MEKEFVQEKNIQASVSIKDCRLISFALSEFGLSNREFIQQEDSVFEFRMNLVLLDSEKYLVFDFESILFQKTSENQKNEIGKIKGITTFHITQYDQIIRQTDSGTTNIPDQLIFTCVLISISNLRGMLAAKLVDTIYSNLVIPFIDPKLFLPKKT
jgi:hypothetical protein